MKKLVDNIIAGFEDALAYLDGDKSRGVSTKLTVPAIDVKSIRKKTGLTQEEFSDLFAIKTRTLQDWEQSKKIPSVSAQVFLTLVDQNPSAVKKTLKALTHQKKSSAKKEPNLSSAKIKKIAPTQTVKRKLLAKKKI